MQAQRSINSTVPLKSRVSTQVALLFVATFLGVLILLMAWTMLSTISDRRESAANSDVASPVIVIDPKIQSDLAKALAFDALPTSGEVLNPFVDRAGLSGAVTSNVVRPQSQTISSGGSATTGGSPASTMQTIHSTGSSSAPAPSVDVYNVRARYDEWIERQKRGEFVGPESEVLVVEDLVPVGYASGGDRGAEVMLFSLALCRTFTFANGTRFWNGWLTGFDEREVTFNFQNGLRRKSYSSAEGCQATDSRLAN